MWLKVQEKGSKRFNISPEERGQKGQVTLMAGHELLGASQVCTSQICGSKLATLALRYSTLARKLEKTGAGRLGRRDNWLPQQLLASHPSVTFPVIKQRYLPKMSENRCKTNVPEPKHAVRGPGNGLLSTENCI